ncbi:Mobile element protein [uncultured Candidatus Thioglobus sp.]|nr:Mobile element protein [uncultured Candidatus Thioglobus sp.]
MVVINFQEQIQPGTFEYAVHYLLDNKLDLSLFKAIKPPIPIG